MTTTKPISLLLASSLATIAAPATAETFSPQLFGDNIEKAMAPVTVGWAYSIVQNGVPVVHKGGGSARTKTDTFRAHGPHVRQNIASVSKTITAIATLQLLAKLNLPPETQIGPYLPADWKKGPNINDLTFSDLLRHTSGIPSNPYNSIDILKYEAVQAQILAGTTKRPAGGERPGSYANMNFAVLRVLIPGLWAKAGGDPYKEALGMYGQLPVLKLGSPGLVGNWNVYAYIAYVQKNVMEPIGIKGALCSDRSSTQTLYYTPAGDKPGVKSFADNDWTRACGSGGWYLSTNALTNLLANVRNGSVLPPKYRDLMFSRSFGVSSFSTTGGTGYGKSGTVGADGGAGLRACLIGFPGKVEVAAVENSATTVPLDMCEMLKTAYKAAWK